MRAAIFAIAVSLCAAVILACGTAQASRQTAGKFPIVKSDDEWRKVLSPAAYNILRQKGTEQAFTGRYWNNHANGIYVCAACGNELFSSKTKFESGTGWPSFWQPIRKDAVVYQTDKSWDMEVRTEVLCSRCGGHLGHVFDDGPKPTGKRYCMNSAAMVFKPAK